MKFCYLLFIPKQFLKVFTVLILICITTIFGIQGDFFKFKFSNNTPKHFKKTVSTGNDPHTIYLNTGELNTQLPALQAAKNTSTNFAGSRMHLVKFKDAIQPSYYKILTDAGAEVIDYIPNYTYLVWLTGNALQRIQQEAAKANSPIEWEGTYLPEYRIMPDLYISNDNNRTVTGTQFTVQLYKRGSDNNNSIAYLQRLNGNEKLYSQEILKYVNIVVNTNGSNIDAIAQLPDVISIHPYIEPKRRDESQNIILSGQMTAGIPTAGSNYLTYLSNVGFTQAQFDASNFVVNVVDGGLDSGSVGGTMRTTRHFALYKNGDPAQGSRVAFIRGQGTFVDSDTKGCEGHGNINTHIVGGYVPNALIGVASHSDANSFRYGLGVAPFVKVANTTIFEGPATGGSFTNPTLSSIESEAYRDGARISSNSWGSAAGGAYNTTAQTYDALVRDAQPTGASVATAGNQEMTIVFSAGNSGSGANTIGAPGTGKNIISVAAGEGVRAFGGADGCGETDASANNANDMATFSSRGPCDDGRVKPDITLPGTHITGGVFPSATNNATSGTGVASPCFDGSGVCGGVASNYFPAGQQWYTASSGTSHSCPAIAGMAALVRQYYINKGLTAPSPAMTKATIMHSASYMNGTGTGENLPGNNQGMGLANFNNVVTALNNPNMVRDQVAVDMFTATGQVRNRTGTVASSTQPVRITLAYTDAPGSTAGNAYVNNLDLEVTVGSTVYKGNVFTNGLSVTGGVADVRNNVEAVFLPAGTTGNISVRVIATNIAGDGVPNVGTALDQDYALLISNITETFVPLGNSTGATITAESCGTGLTPDPQEQLTVSLPITNAGTANFSNLIATLQVSGGIVSPSGAQNYGALAINGTTSRSFSFFVSNTQTCGSTINLTWNLTDGATNYGSITRSFSVGSISTTLSQNFDGVTTPILPAGFTQNQISGTGITWVTSTTTPSSTPNCAFANNPATVNATAIESPSFAVNIPNGTVTFTKAYTTESTFDGVVFEVKIGAGAWTDILTAGGSFASGGYTGVLSNAYSNPIGGRQAWTGTATAFTTTVVNLPASANGQNVQVRWVMGSDNAVASTGFRVDDVVITASLTCSPCSTLPLNLLSFTGSQEAGYNKLLWKTSNEVNTQSFDLEYALDGVNFSKAYSIMANGNGANNYLQKDNGNWIKNNLVYYRLKMIDRNGQFTYSNIITLRNSSNTTLTTSIYPNPTKDKATLITTDNKLIGTYITINDTKGSILDRIKIINNSTLLYVEKYAAGTYIIKLENGESIKIVKQ